MTQNHNPTPSEPIPGHPAHPLQPDKQTPPAEPDEVLGRHKNDGQLGHKGAR